MNVTGVPVIVRLVQKHRISYCIERYFHVTNVNNKVSSALREGKFMSKLLSRAAPKKKWFPERAPRTANPFSSIDPAPMNPHVTRRTIVLNKIFMGHITDLMATGEVSELLLGRGIEISKVEMTPDFKIARVYWFSTNSYNLDETAKLLNNLAYQIRHELTQLRVIGMVPIILFVQDAKMMAIQDLENKFLTADYGEDYTPTITVAPKRQLTLYTKLPDDVREKIRKIKNEIKEVEVIVNDSNPDEVEDEDEIYNVDLPPMRHDVLTFDHYKAMSAVKQALKKTTDGSPDITLDHDWRSPPEASEVKCNPMSLITLRTPDDDETFQEFLIHRKLEEQHIHKIRATEVKHNAFDEEDFDEYEQRVDEDEDYDDFDDFKPSQLE